MSYNNGGQSDRKESSQQWIPGDPYYSNTSVPADYPTSNPPPPNSYQYQPTNLSPNITLYPNNGFSPANSVPGGVSYQQPLQSTPASGYIQSQYGTIMSGNGNQQYVPASSAPGYGGNVGAFGGNVGGYGVPQQMGSPPSENRYGGGGGRFGGNSGMGGYGQQQYLPPSSGPGYGTILNGSDGSMEGYGSQKQYAAPRSRASGGNTSSKISVGSGGGGERRPPSPFKPASKRGAGLISGLPGHVSSDGVKKPARYFYCDRKGCLYKVPFKTLEDMEVHKADDGAHNPLECSRKEFEERAESLITCTCGTGHFKPSPQAFPMVKKHLKEFHGYTEADLAKYGFDINKKGKMIPLVFQKDA